MPQPDVYAQAVRSGSLVRTWTVDASRGGAPVAGATGMAPAGGGVTDSGKSGIRRTLNVTLSGGQALYDLLAPTGTRLTVTEHVRYTNRATVDIPHGVFVVDSQQMEEGEGQIDLTAPDLFADVARRQFLRPQASTRGITVRAQIAALLGAPLTDTATSDATVGALVWDKDRGKAVTDLAADIGAWIYYDRGGAAVLTDLPTVGKSADWLLDAGGSGVVTQLGRERSRGRTANVVAVSSSASGSARFATQYVWDNNPASPTYAGPDPVNNPAGAGPFGVVPYFYDSPNLSTVSQARTVGYRLLYRLMGLESQISAQSAPNPAIDSGDVLDVVAPRESRTLPRPVERHLVDTVTHPLTVNGEQQIDGRSTIPDDLEGAL